MSCNVYSLETNVSTLGVVTVVIVISSIISAVSEFIKHESKFALWQMNDKSVQLGYNDFATLTVYLY